MRRLRRTRAPTVAEKARLEKEVGSPTTCLVCSDPDHYSGCLACGKVIPRQAGWCSAECREHDMINEPRQERVYA